MSRRSLLQPPAGTVPPGTYGSGSAVPVIVVDAFGRIIGISTTAVSAGSSIVDFKDSVRVATTTAGTLASDFENGDTVDGITLATGDRILIKNQSSGAENGIYVVASSGAPTRATDFDADAEVTGGCIIPVTVGTQNGDKLFMLTTNDPITVGVTSLSFSPYGTGGVSGSLTITTPDNNTTPLTVNNSTAAVSISLDTKDVAGTGRARIVFESGGDDELRMVANTTGTTILRLSSDSPSADVTAAVNTAIGLRVVSASNSSAELVHYNQNVDDTSTVADQVVSRTNSNGTAAAGFGSRTLWKLESSTTDDQEAASQEVLWTTATHASRTSAIVFKTIDNAGSLTERCRINANGIQVGNTVLGNGGVQFPIDVPPSSPNANDDEFSTGSTWSGSWTLYESTAGYLGSSVVSGAGLLWVNTASTNILQSYYKTIAAGDRKYRAKVALNGLPATTMLAGMYFSDATKAVALYIRQHATSTQYLESAVGKWTTKSSFSANYSGNFAMYSMGWFAYIEIERSGSTLYFRTSADGRIFKEITNTSETDFLSSAAVEVGLFIATPTITTNYAAFEWFRQIT